MDSFYFSLLGHGLILSLSPGPLTRSISGSIREQSTRFPRKRPISLWPPLPSVRLLFSLSPSLFSSLLTFQEIRNPLEPLLIRLIKGYVDDADLTRRLKTLYQAM